MKKILLSLLLVSCSSLQQAKYPEINSAAIAALNTTDIMLTTAITTSEDTQVNVDKYEDYVTKLKAARDVIEKIDSTKKDICAVLPVITIVAAGIKCEACQKVTDKALEIGGC
jgi:hypothetical protein